jgi:hypothetical protein
MGRRRAKWKSKLMGRKQAKGEKQDSKKVKKGKKPPRSRKILPSLFAKIFCAIIK